MRVQSVKFFHHVALAGMKHSESKALKQLAAKYVWWKTPDEAMAWPDRVIAQVMDMGDYADVQILANQLGDDRLSDVLTHAQAGQFGERAWAYWHYRLGLAALGEVPKLPVRRFA